MYLMLTRRIASLLIQSTPQDDRRSAMRRNPFPSSDITVRPSLEAVAPVLSHYRTHILPVVQALLPRSIVGDGQCNTAEELSAMHLKLLVYMVTNRMPGISKGFPLDTVYEYLKEPVGKLLSGNCLTSIRTDSILSLLPVAEFHFVGAIEAGDVYTVDSLLLSGIRGIDANDTVCVIDGAKYTPIERSARLQHLTLTKLLLKAGADVNKSHAEVDEGHWTDRMEFSSGNAEPCGALENAWKSRNKSSGHELATVLAQAGGQCGSHMLQQILSSEDTKMIEILIRHGLRRFYPGWAQNGFLQRCAIAVSRGTLYFMVAELNEMGFDLSTPIDANPHKRYCTFWQDRRPPLFLIDVAAQRGDMDLVVCLRGRGAQMTSDVLIAAVQSRNAELVRYLVDEGAPLDDFSFYSYSTPLAEALRTPDQEIVLLLTNVVDIGDIKDKNCFCATLAAIAEVGDMQMLRRCLEMRHHCSEAVLGYALTKAILAHQLGTAEILLNAGASLDSDCISGLFDSRSLPDHHSMKCMKQISPLVGAILTHQTAMAMNLLDHGAECDAAVHAAVQCGDPAILDEVIPASAPLWAVYGMEPYLHSRNDAFGEALNADDVCWFQRLLSAGCNPSQDILVNAVHRNNLEIVQMLKEWGVNCLMPGMLGMAVTKSSEMFRLILREMKSRLGRDLGMWGVEALDIAIQSDRADLVKILMDNGASCSAYREFGEVKCALATAIRRQGGQDLQLVSTLLKLGTDPDEIISEVKSSNELFLGTKCCETALLVAISTEQPKMVQLLIDHGSNINLAATGRIKRTPLQQAAENGSNKIVRLLLEQGANVNCPPAARSGGTALQLAAFAGNMGVVELLLDHGADPVASGSIVGGRTAIEGAAECGRTDIVPFLLRNCSPPLHQIIKAKQKAQENNHQAIVDMLEEAEAEAVGRSSSFGQHLIHAHNPTGGQPSALEEVQEPVGNNIEPDQNRRTTCSICHDPLSNNSALRRHERTKHPEQFPPTKWECEECSSTFTRKDTLDRHSKTHNRSGYTQCSFCVKSFRPDYLSQHMMSCQG